MPQIPALWQPEARFKVQVQPWQLNETLPPALPQERNWECGSVQRSLLGLFPSKGEECLSVSNWVPVVSITLEAEAGRALEPRSLDWPE